MILKTTGRKTTIGMKYARNPKKGKEAYLLRKKMGLSWREINIKIGDSVNIGTTKERAERYAKFTNSKWPLKMVTISGCMYEDVVSGLSWKEVAEDFGYPIFKCRCYVRRYCEVRNIPFPE